MKHFIWWLTQADYEKQTSARRPSEIPKNIWIEVESRCGRGGRFRLWIPEGISYTVMPSDIPDDHWLEFKSRTADAGGIVITEEHIDACLNWGGIVTTDRLELIHATQKENLNTSQLYSKFQNGIPLSTKELKKLKEKLEEFNKFFLDWNILKINIPSDVESIERIIEARKTKNY